MQQQGIDDRTLKLIGEENLSKLKTSKVAIVGLGGVGSICAISLVMSEIKNLIIIDDDKVVESNLNRQIAYELSDIGKFKVDAMEEKLNRLRNYLNITKLNKRVSNEFDFSVLNGANYVVDCIDDINAKVLLIKYCFENNIEIITSLGMGNKLDPTNIKIISLNKTTIDPLAKKLRYNLKQEGIDTSKVMTAFSDETPMIKDRVISSMVFVPNTCGLTLASYVVRKLIGGL